MYVSLTRLSLSYSVFSYKDNCVVPNTNIWHDHNVSRKIGSSRPRRPHAYNQLLGRKIENEEEPVLPRIFVESHKRLLQLYDLIDDGTQTVTDARNAAILNELEKQRNEELRRFDLESYIAKKEKEAQEEYKKLDEKWDEIVEITDPLTISNEAARHREKCNGLLDEKDKIIEHLKGVLKEKDEAFIKEIEDEGAEVNVLLDRIEEQIFKSKEAFTKELESLEEIIEEEKKAMIKTNREKWEKLIEEKDQVDKAFIEKICDIIESYKQPLLLAEKEHSEYKRIMRTKLDKYVHDLTIQTDFLKSVCSLNLEKLSYNQQLLYNKQKDNKMIKEHCKKYNTRIGNNLINARRKNVEKRINIIKKINLCEEKINMLENKIEAIDKRCDDLALSNSKHYFKLWDFMEKEINELIEQICTCDKIIFEECLLIPWVPPNLQISKPPCYNEAMNLISKIKEKKNIKPKKLPDRQISQMQKLSKIILEGLQYSLVNRNMIISDSIANDNRKQRLLMLNNLFATVGVTTGEHIELLLKYFFPYIVCPECESLPSQKVEDSKGDKTQRHVSPPRFVADELSSENFTETESQSTESLLDELSQDGCKSENLDIARSTFEVTSKIVSEETLFIKNDEKYAWKVDPFNVSFSGEYPEPDIPIDQALTNIDGADCDPPGDQIISRTHKNDKVMKICSNENHHPYINPLDITKALEDFTMDVFNAKETPIGVINNKGRILQKIPIQLHVISREPSFNIEIILNKPRTSPSRLIVPSEVTEYWESYLNVVSPKKIQLWESMISVIQDYQQALLKRHRLNEEMKKLRLSNSELKRLMKRYCEDSLEEK